jgi:hypothetical protein
MRKKDLLHRTMVYKDKRRKRWLWECNYCTSLGYSHSQFSAFKWAFDHAKRYFYEYSL